MLCLPRFWTPRASFWWSHGWADGAQKDRCQKNLWPPSSSVTTCRLQTYSPVLVWFLFPRIPMLSNPVFFWLEDGPQFAPKKNHPTKTHQDDFKNPIGKPFKVMKLSSEFFPPIGSMYGIYLPLFTHISTEITIGAGIFTLHIYLSMGLVYLPLFIIYLHFSWFCNGFHVAKFTILT